MPSSSSAATEPLTRTWPLFGLRMRASTFSVVDLPEPLGPTMPRVDPCGTSKLTPLSAQNSSNLFDRPMKRSLRVCERSW